MNWNDISATYGEFITKDIDDTRTYPCELQIFFESSEDADRALNKISSAIAAQLRPTNEGPSDQSGARRYHVVHQGSLTGAQYKEYLCTVVDAGGQIWEAFAR